MSNKFDLYIDEGHGGVDNGTSGGGMKEDTRNLLLGDVCIKLAKRQGWNVARTRTADKAASLQSRYEQANKVNADAFIAIHHDWKLGEQAVIYANSNDSRESKSKKLADSISDNIDKLAPTKSVIYADRRGLAVLKGTHMPAVIIEASRIQDRYDAEVMGEAIIKGICEWLGMKYVTGSAAPKPPVKKDPYTLTKVLSKGSKGVAVKYVQIKLGLSIDGVYGAVTEAGVRKYQKKHGLKVDGIVGSEVAHHFGWRFK